MVNDNHYKSLRGHILHLLSGLMNHEQDLPDDLNVRTYENFYCEALESLEERKIKMDKRKKDYLEAKEKFYEDYSHLRKSWKKDLVKIKRRLNHDTYLMKLFGANGLFK